MLYTGIHNTRMTGMAMESIEQVYVSVVMTSYNREKYIAQAIDSILAQDCSFPYEIVIGDDCSTDNSRALLTSYKERYPDVFVLNFHQVNQGFGANWASTVKLARGKYIAFLDDDDYWCDTHHMQSLADYLDANDQCGLVYANRWILDVANNTKTLANAKLPDNEDKLSYMLHKGFPILFSASMLRKSLMDKYVDLDAFIRLRFPIQDFPTAVLLSSHCDFHYIEKPTVVYRSYSGSMSKPQDYDTVIRKYTQEKVMNRYLYEQLGLPYDEPGDDCYRYGILLRLAYERGDYCSARKFAKHVDPYDKKKYFAFTWLTFHCFRLAKRIKSSMNKARGSI